MTDDFCTVSLLNHYNQTFTYQVFLLSILCEMLTQYSDAKNKIYIALATRANY